MLKINELTVKINKKTILDRLTLSIGKGETHAIMGRNGSGKSTLSNIITGKSGYTLTKGTIHYKNKSIIGVIHSTVQFWDISLYKDIKAYTNIGFNLLKIPDGIAVNGNYAKDKLIEANIPKEKILTNFNLELQ